MYYGFILLSYKFRHLPGANLKHIRQESREKYVKVLTENRLVISTGCENKYIYSRDDLDKVLIEERGDDDYDTDGCDVSIAGNGKYFCIHVCTCNMYAIILVKLINN